MRTIHCYYKNKVYLCFIKYKYKDMKITKEEVIQRIKQSIARKKEWERKFDERYANITNLYNSCAKA